MSGAVRPSSRSQGPRWPSWAAFSARIATRAGFTLTIAAAAVTATIAASDQSREQKLQQAIDLIESKGDLARAMPMLEEVATSADRALAARALLHLAQAQERLGREPARRTYERIIRDFSTQTAIVAQARARLAALDRTVPAPDARPSARRVWSVAPGAYSPPQISSDARFLAYCLGNSFHLYDAVGGSARRVDGYAAGTTGSGANHGGHAFSRDSQLLAYGWNVEDREQLRIVSLARTGPLQPRVLVDRPDIGGVVPLGWAPDKSWIAVHLTRRAGSTDRRPGSAAEGWTREIALVSTSDGTIRTLRRLEASRRFFESAVLSHDGRYLAVSPQPRISGSPRDVLVIATDGSGEQTDAVVHASDDRLLGWSADDKQVLFLSGPNGRRALWSLTFEHGKFQGSPRQVQAALTIGADLDNIENQGLTPSGAWYFSTFPKSHVTVKTASFDFGAGRFVSPIVDAVADLGTNRAAKWSADGTQLAWITQRQLATKDAPVYVLGIRSLETNAVRELPLGLSNFSFDNSAYWGWMPDARGLIAVGTDLAGRKGIHRIDAATGHVSLLAADEPGLAIWVNNVWGPSGTLYFMRLADIQKEFNQEWTLHEFDPATARERELFRSEPGQLPLHFRPGGLYLFREKDGSKAIVEHDFESGRERDLVRDPRLTPRIHVSPDGRLGLTREADVPEEPGSNWPTRKTRRVIAIDFARGELREVARLDPAEWTNFPGTWSRDSRSYVVQRAMDGRWAYWWIPLDGRPPHKVEMPFEATPPRAEYGGLLQWRVHPDGRRVVFGVAGGPTDQEVWMIENLLQPAGRGSR